MQRPRREIDPGAGSRLVIVKDGRQTPIPYPYSLDDAISVKMRIKDEAKAYNHGADVVGDGKVESRKIKVGLHVKGETQRDHDRAMNFAYGVFGQRDYELLTGRPDRAYKVAGATEIKGKYIRGYKERWSDIDVTLLLADPFRYARLARVCVFPFEWAQDQTPCYIYNEGNIDTPLKITLAPLATMPDVVIEHAETGRLMQLRDSLLANPAEIIADTENGTVRRGDWNTINAFSGQFLFASPGANIYIVTCGAGTVTISYTERWLV